MRFRSSHLKRLRVLAGLTQQELGARAGVTQQTVAYIEGNGSPRPSTAKALADALGVDVSSLYEETAA